MARRIDIEEQRGCLKISFPYERELVNVVRSLPDRWYESATKTWFVPLKHLQYVMQQLGAHHFQISATLRDYCDQNGQDTNPAAPSSPAGVDQQAAVLPPDTFTVSKLNQAARAVLRDHFPQEIWLVGELQDFDKNVASNYRTYFFDLVERPYAGAKEIARLKAVLFEEGRRAIEARLAQLPETVRLRDSLSVRLKVRVDLYPQNGRYQVIVSDIDPAYTTGEIEMNRERVFRALQARGVHEVNRRLEMPACPLRVGLITSYESDAYNDFVHQLQASGLGFELTMHHASVQGHNTEASVLRALEYFRRRASEFDVIAIVRGGGSRSDLAYFDTEAVGMSVCNHPVKVICGVGHQRDQCLLDLIAHSTKTPTAAAELIVSRVSEAEQAAVETFDQIRERASRSVTEAKRRLLVEMGRVERSVGACLRSERAQANRINARITHAGRKVLSRADLHINLCRERVDAQAQLHFKRGWQQVQYRRERLASERIARLLRLQHDHLEQGKERLERAAHKVINAQGEELRHMGDQLRLLDPQRVLERGFAIVRLDDRLIRSEKEIPLGQHIQVRLADGTLTAIRTPDD